MRSARLPGLLLLLYILNGCGGSNEQTASVFSAFALLVESSAPLASADISAVTKVTPGSTPFIAFIDLSSTNISTLDAISYAIRPMQGTFSKPVAVSFSAAYLTSQSYAFPGSQVIRVPIFGLYAGYSNSVDISLQFTDGSVRQLPTTGIITGNYSGNSALYTTPVKHVVRNASDNLGFSFFYMKNSIGTPVIVDTDGNVRWLGVAPAGSNSSSWYQNGFIAGSASDTSITRYELDGRIATNYITEPLYTDFNHNIDIGPSGLLGEFDQAGNRMSAVAEFSPDGKVLKEWNLATIISDYMLANGDDPGTFVIPASDWFHSNASAYDQSDNSLIISSRENFLIKIDYDTGQIIWIFGDPTKYWHTFPSLRAKAVTLTTGLYPIGQHAVSITPQGYLQVFNDGVESLVLAPAGDHRSYSTVSTYSIDKTNRTATQVSQFDNGKSILSGFCSSAYTEKDESMIISYSVATAGSATPLPGPVVVGNTAQLVGLNPSGSPAFDFEYPTNGCATSFNADVVRLESLNFS